MALALAALERVLPTLPAVDLAAAEKSSITRTCQAVLAGVVKAVAQAWLGYLPPALGDGGDVAAGGGAPGPLLARLQETAPLCHAVFRLLGSWTEWGTADEGAGVREALPLVVGPGSRRAEAMAQLETRRRAAPR